jgi:hypothetical protein
LEATPTGAGPSGCLRCSFADCSIFTSSKVMTLG